MSDAIFGGWFWISKEKDNSLNKSTRFVPNNFKKKKKRWILISNIEIFYCHAQTALLNDRKQISLDNCRPILEFDSKDAPTRVYLVDSNHQTISVVLEPENSDTNLQDFCSLIGNTIKNKFLNDALNYIDIDSDDGLRVCISKTVEPLGLLSDALFSSVGSAIHYATLKCSVKCLQFLLLQYGKNSLYFKNNDADLPIHIASQSSSLPIIKCMWHFALDNFVKSSELFNMLGKDNYTPLHYAIDDEVVAFLLKNEAEIEATDINGYTPLHIAAKRGNLNCLNELLDCNAKINAIAWKSGETSLMCAACVWNSNQADDSDECVMELLDRGADASIVDNMNKTALHHACQHGNIAVCSELINVGIDVNLQDVDGVTAICFAAGVDNFDVGKKIVALLLSKGAYPKIRDYEGRQVLHYAASKGNLEVIMMLITHDSDINAVDYQGHTALEIVQNTVTALKLDDVMSKNTVLVTAFDECEAFLKSSGAVERFVRDIPVEQNCRDIMFSYSRNGTYSVAAASPWALVNRITTFPYFSQNEASNFLTSYRPFIRPVDLLQLLKMRFYILQNMHERLVENCSSQLFSLGFFLMETKAITLWLLKLESQQPPRDKLTSLKRFESGQIRSEDSIDLKDETNHSESRASPIPDTSSNHVIDTSPTVSPGKTGRSKESSTLDLTKTKLVKGIESVAHIDGMEVQMNHTTISNPIDYEDSDEVLRSFIRALGKVFPMEMFEQDLLLVCGRRYINIPKIHIHRQFASKSSWSVKLTGDCNSISNITSVASSNTEEDQSKRSNMLSKIININSLELSCRPGGRLAKGKVWIEMNVVLTINNWKEQLKSAAKIYAEHPERILLLNLQESYRTQLYIDFARVLAILTKHEAVVVAGKEASSTKLGAKLSEVASVHIGLLRSKSEKNAMSNGAMLSGCLYSQDTADAHHESLLSSFHMMRLVEKESIRGLSKFSPGGVFGNRYLAALENRKSSVDASPPLDLTLSFKSESSIASFKLRDSEEDDYHTFHNFTAVRGFIQFLTCWCSQFYEEDFEKNVMMKTLMSDFVHDFMTTCCDLIENEYDPTIFTLFIDFDQAVPNPNLIVPVIDMTLNEEETTINTKSSSIPAPPPPPLRRKISYDEAGEELPPMIVKMAKKNSMRESICSKRVSARSGPVKPRRRGTMIDFVEPVISRSRTSAVMVSLDAGMSFVFDILMIKTQVMAEQISLLMHTLFCKIKSNEFLSNDHPNLTEYQNNEIHVMNWMTSQVLQSKTTEECAIKISYWIEVSKWMEVVRNFAGMFCVLTILQAQSVYRLKKAWSKVTPAHMDLFLKQKALFQLDHNFARFRQFMSDNPLLPPSLPFLGLFLKDFVFIKQLPNETCPGIINVIKVNAISSKLKVLMSYQITPYYLEKHYEILETLKTLPKYVTEDEQWDASNILEPTS